MLSVWQLSDGKPGHDNQVRGLIEAMARRTTVQEQQLQPLATSQALRMLSGLAGRYREDLPSPDLIIAAGHHTHLSLLALKRNRGGRSVVIMSPSLPSRLFDLCLIPRHDVAEEDRQNSRPHILYTDGALNRIRHSREQQPDRGLMLIGGPSRNHGWDESSLVERLQLLHRLRPDIHWTVTDSRRTPDSTRRLLRSLGASFDYHAADETDADWLAQQLATAGQTWVTADSVSMVYEALSSGSLVGLLPVPVLGETRVSRGIEDLQRRGLIGYLDKAGESLILPQTGSVLQEADRCADWILQHWFQAGEHRHAG